MGRDMLKGGGKMVIAAGDRKTGPDTSDATSRMTALRRCRSTTKPTSTRAVVACSQYAPLLWKNDWPVAGEAFKEGTYEIESERRGYALELAVDFVRMNTERRRFWEKTTSPLSPSSHRLLKM